MEQLFTSGFGQLAVGLAIMATLVGVAAYVVKKIHPKSAQQERTTSELLTNFRELHARGELSEAEFRTIKTTLAAKLQAELKGNDERG
jgi:uncharacterized membrane protein